MSGEKITAPGEEILSAAYAEFASHTARMTKKGVECSKCGFSKVEDGAEDIPYIKHALAAVLTVVQSFEPLERGRVVPGNVVSAAANRGENRATLGVEVALDDLEEVSFTEIVHITKTSFPVNGSAAVL